MMPESDFDFKLKVTSSLELLLYRMEEMGKTNKDMNTVVDAHEIRQIKTENKLKDYDDMIKRVSDIERIITSVNAVRKTFIWVVGAQWVVFVAAATLAVSWFRHG